MKKLLLLFTVLLCINLHGQIGRYPLYTAPVAASEEALDDDVTTYVTGLSTELHDSVLTRINTFVVALKDSLDATTLSEDFDIMYILANGTAEAALRNLVERDNDATNVSATSFTALEGYTGDGVADYLNTGFNPSTEGSTYTLNSASYGGYIRVMNATGSHMSLMGALESDDNPSILLSPNRGASNRYYNINNANTGVAFDNNNEGVHIVNRSADNARAWSAPDQDYTSTTASTSIPNMNVYILAANVDAGTDVYNYSTMQVSFIFMGRSFTARERAAIRTCFNAYMTANGKATH